LLEGRFQEGDTIVVDTEGDTLRLRSQRELEGQTGGESPQQAEESPALVE